MAMHESDHRVMRLVEVLARRCAQQLLIEAVGRVDPCIALGFGTQHRQCTRKCTQTAPEIVLFPHAASVKPTSNRRPLLKSRSLVTLGTIPECWKACGLGHPEPHWGKNPLRCGLQGAWGSRCDAVKPPCGAGTRIRTGDLPLTRRLLYQLSYAG